MYIGGVGDLFKEKTGDRGATIIANQACTLDIVLYSTSKFVLEFFRIVLVVRMT